MCIQGSLVFGPILAFWSKAVGGCGQCRPAYAVACNVLPRLKAQDVNVHFATSQYGRSKGQTTSPG